MKDEWFYYKVAFIGVELDLLTYKSSNKIQPFSLVLASLRCKQTLGCIISECNKPDFNTLEITQILPKALNKFQIELLKFISYYYSSSFGATLSLFELSHLNNTTRNIKFKKIVDRYKIFNLITHKKRPNLSKLQEDAFKFIKQNRTSLMFGDTGSGKSEVYISAIREVLNKGKQALFLMPEISLTPQMKSRLENYFGSCVAVWHSKVTAKKKNEILENIRQGKTKLIAGARSALFLPLDELGLIVVDEEHDDSYKNSISRPHYNAKDLAIFLGSKFDIKVILGSATPSLTTFYKFPSFRMKGTFFNSKKSFIYDASEPSLSQTIKDQIANSLSAKKQVVICLPTRANFKYIVCKECGDTIKCPFCSVGMSFYKKQNLLKCQYCGYKAVVPKTCQKCGSDMMQAKKMGTTELLERLRDEFANAKLAKFDRDEITTQAKLKKILTDFNNREIDILVGTQMLSKGHDYHNVDLSVVMGVDEMLNYPDFRAREKTLALVKQVAGRAGRKGSGRVVIQSYESDFFKRYLDDYDSFLEDEYNNRTALYPPFVRLLRIIISHKDQNRAEGILSQTIKKIDNLKQKYEFDIVGYGKCGIEFLGSKFRYEILIRASSHKPLVAISSLCQDKHIDADIDPLNFT